MIGRLMIGDSNQPWPVAEENAWYILPCRFNPTQEPSRSIEYHNHHANRALSTEDVGALYLLKQGPDHLFTGAWYETKALSGGTPSAGEIHIRLFDDNSCSAVREFNDVAFDLGEGTWRPGKKGAVLVSFTSDFAGETFQGTIKNSVLKGTFSGGGFVGKFVTSPVAVADLP
jgi:hypothetical protein